MTKNIMLEILAGTGGDEASIWGGDWSDVPRYAETQNWKVKLVSESLLRWGLKAMIEIQGEQV